MARNGKAFNEYLHQATPGTAGVHFSDRPLKVAGVKITPKWAWSDGYRKWVRAQHRDLPAGYISGWSRGNSANRRENDYLNWLRCERMPNLTPDEARDVLHNQRYPA